MRLRNLVPASQAFYYVTTGILPLISMRVFQAITGPKVDGWLVKTVGILIAVIGGVIGSAAARGRVTPEITALATGSAAGLTLIDVVYVARKRISPIYLLDALVEAILIIGWIITRKPPVSDKQED